MAKYLSKIAIPAFLCSMAVSFNVFSATPIPWVPGETTVVNGDIVSFQGQCYKAVNSPGSWDSPGASSWFWQGVNCDGTDPVNPGDPTPPGELTITEDGNGGYYIPRSELETVEAELTSGPLFDLVRADIVTLPNIEVEAVQPLRSLNPDNVKRVESIVSSATWDYFFPIRNEKYTYTNFLKGVAKFPAFCRTYTDTRNSDEICKRSLSTMFAHFVQETGANAPNWDGAQGNPVWRQGLYFLRERFQSEDVYTTTYNKCYGWVQERWPCAPQKSYFGRGAKQLSWNYNYGPFSEAIYGERSVLLENPALVADTWLNLASAVFFYLYPQPPKPSMLHVIDGTWTPNASDTANGIALGFGSTIQIINGAFECGKGQTTPQAANRIKYYKLFSQYLGLDISAEKLDCADMQPFDAEGAGALQVYLWWKDGWKPNTPGNKTFECQLVGYQTPYSTWNQGDYERCIEKHFNVTATDQSGSPILD